MDVFGFLFAQYRSLNLHWQANKAFYDTQQESMRLEISNPDRDLDKVKTELCRPL